VVTDGRTRPPSQFAAYYARDDNIIAVAAMGRDPTVSKAAELLRLKQMPKLSEIKGGTKILEVDISGKLGQ
jgi:hypothetical protein